MDIKSRKLIPINRAAMEEALKCLNIGAKVLARRSNAIWNVLVETENAAEPLITKSVRLQMEYMGTRRTKVTLHREPLYITENHFGFFFAKFREVVDISSVKSKVGIATGDFEVTVTLTKKNFMDIPNVLICGSRPIYVVEGCHPLCWSCDTVRHLSKSCLEKRPAPQPKLPTSRETTGTETITKLP